MRAVMDRVMGLVNNAPPRMEVLDWLFDGYKDRVANGYPVVLYGTGSLAKSFLETLKNHGVSPVCFCNSDPSKSGGSYCGVPVISVEELKASHPESLVLVSTQTHAAAVKKGLLDNGFPRDRVRWQKEFDMALALYFCFTNQSVLGFHRTRSPQRLLEVLRENEDKVQKAYDLFADQKSKDLYAAKLAFLIGNENLELFKNFMLPFSEPIAEFGLIPFPSLGPENYFYFNNDVFPLSEKEIFVDMGAFDGDSITAFVQACRNRGVNYEHIYAFEPDPRNYDALLRTTGHMQKISYHKLGLWSHRKVLRFESSDKAFTTTASGVHENGDIEIEVVGLDEFLQGEKVTLIKMDPPGDILRDALQGAAETITRHKPKLVLNAYNKLEDIFEVPLLVNRRWPDYRLYLRHISWTICETDLFAVA